MKISQKTMMILENFSTINPALLFQPGNVLRTMSTEGDILARAVVDETFPVECVIGDLSEWLGCFKLVSDADAEFRETDMTILGPESKVDYLYTSNEITKIDLGEDSGASSFACSDETDDGLGQQNLCSFVLPESLFKKLLEVPKVMKKNQTVLISDFGTGIKITVTDSTNTDSKDFTYFLKREDAQDPSSVRNFAAGTDWKVRTSISQLKIIPGTYRVTINDAFMTFDLIDEDGQVLAYGIALDVAENEHIGGGI